MRLRTLGLVSVLALLLAFPALATPSALTTTIMRWSGKGDSPDAMSATFIPFLIPIPLLEIPYANWPAYEKQKVPQAAYDQFWAVVQDLVASGVSGCAGPALSCGYPGETLDQRTEPITAAALARSFPLVLIGTIVHEVPAWDFRLGRMASITYIKVDEVIKHEQTSRHLPAYVSISREYGTAQVQGITLCSLGKGLPGTEVRSRQAKEYGQVLLVGSLDSGNSEYVSTSYELIFRVDGGDLLYPPGIKAFPSASMSLVDFKAQLED
jgi:hypothetical protein